MSCLTSSISIRHQHRKLRQPSPSSDASGGVHPGAAGGCPAAEVLPRGLGLSAPGRVGRGFQLAERAAAHVGAGTHGDGGRGRARHPQLRRHQVGARRARRALQAPHGLRPPRHPGALPLSTSSFFPTQNKFENLCLSLYLALQSVNNRLNFL